MERVGQSRSTPKISLKCNDPCASFESGACHDGWNYSLESNMYSHNNIVISRHDSERRSVLNHNKYEMTLKQWLEERKEKKKNNWDDEYGKWKVCRPEEEARQIIQGILRAVCELHTAVCELHTRTSSHEFCNFFHGFLYHPENFVIQNNELVIGGDQKKSKHVFLIHENHRLKNISGVPTNNNTQLGDRLAVSNVIFEQILGATDEEWCYPPDLQNLHDLLKQNDVSSKEWKLIVNHPSLWHWKSRFDYPERVWMHYKNAHPNSNVYRRMKEGFEKISVSGWEDNIAINSPLWRVYTYDNYGDQTLDLLHYLRNVRVHYKQHVRRHSYDEEFFNTQFVELEITEISELFLVQLYSMMCDNNIEI